ncbi:sporulation related protein [Paenibacillus taihuensis]|uniref:Sporulation related protein n=1 Tax=Paenibacillus taihuensis TaxID=1156355 RepID=A0A3D9R366_9BACL|nr:SPOR domain-containing protein [Paenibacillus taihuensis]REE69506.1 sporulation related protein [Paenibacillus taihuensis]
MNNKGRITYRFDSSSGARMEPKQEEKQQQGNSANAVPYFQEELKFTSDIGTWNSPFQNDAHALEQLIREADGQIPKQKQKQSQTPSQPQKQNPRQAEQDLEAADPFYQNHHQHRLHADRQQSSHTPIHPYPETDVLEPILLGDEYEEAPIKKPAQPPQIIDMYPIIDVEEEDRYRRAGSNNRAAKSPYGAFLPGTAGRPGKGPSWFKVFASVTGAIATGALFGYFVLTLFTSGGGATGNDAAPVTTNPSSDTSTDAAASGTDKAANSGKDATAANSNNKGTTGTATNNTSSGQTDAQSAMVQVKVPAASYYMLQYGVFSNKEGLDAAVSELDEKGLAAASLSSSEDYRVYVGMSSDKDNAQLLGQLLTGMDVYVKQIDLPPVSSIPFKGDSSVVESFFSQTNDLMSKLDSLTLEQLSGSSSGLGGFAQKDWKELHETWTQSASLMEAGMTDKVNKTALLKLVQSINTAAVAADAYVKKPSEAYLWSMQKALMEAVFTQKGWFASMDAL